ncbi:MAG: diguanylate cyclase [Pseudomonadota bacterium]
MPSGVTPDWHQPARLLRLAALVGLLCWLSIALTRGEGRIASIWLSNGLVLGVLLSVPPSRWLAVLLAAFSGNLAANLGSGDSIGMALILASCNSFEVMLAAWPMYRRFGNQTDLTNGLGLLYFLVFCLLLAPAASGLLASAALAAHAGGDLQAIFSVWYPADAMGLMIVTPLTLALLRQGELGGRRLRWRRALLPWLFLTSMCLLLFTQSRYPLLFLAFPPLLLLSYQQGLAGSALGLATITVIALLATINGHGPFMLIQTDSLQTRVLVLQLFVAVATAQSLVMGMLQAQQRRLSLALRDSGRQLRTITDNLPALIAQFDTEERYRFANAHVGRVFGGDPAAMLGRTLREVRGEMIYADLSPHVAKALQGEAASFESFGMANGKPYHYQSNYIPDVAADGRVQGFFAMTFDITERKNAELRQAADEERLRTISDNLPALIAYIDREGTYRFCNQTYADWFGKSLKDWHGSDYRWVMGDAFADAQASHLNAAFKGERIETELLLPCRDGPRTVKASYVPHIDHRGDVLGAYVLMHDVTDLKAVQTQLSQLASHDMLTGLANRREFQAKLENAIGRNRRQVSGHALMFLDIDHFKAINDSRGHAAGDAVLREVALRLQASVRHTDIVARLAGDEFVVILDGLHGSTEAELIAQKIIAAMGSPVAFGDDAIVVGVSIGIAFDAEAALGPEELLSLADSALYRAKAAGRNTWRLQESSNPA